MELVDHPFDYVGLLLNGFDDNFVTKVGQKTRLPFRLN